MIRYMQLALIALMMMFAAPALAAPPDAGAPDAAAEDAKADEAKSPDAEGEAKAAEESKEDAKAEDAEEEAATDGDSGTSGGDEPAELKSDEEAGDAVEGLYKALMDKNWALALSLGLMILVFVARKVPMLDKIPPKATPWVAAGLSMLGYVAAALMAPGAEIGTAVLSGLSVGAGAVGLWEMVFKHLLTKKKSAEA